MLNIFNKNIPPDCSDRRDEVKLLVSLFSILSHSTTTHLTLPYLSYLPLHIELSNFLGQST